MVDLIIPSWAKRFFYEHHSNPFSQDLNKKLFDKIILRPQIKNLWLTYHNVELPQEEREYAKDLAVSLNTNRSQNPKMRAGQLVQMCCDLLIGIDGDNPKSTDEVCDILNQDDQFTNWKPRDYQDALIESDTASIAEYKESIIDTAIQATQALKEVMREENYIIGEEHIKGYLPQNEIPHYTIPDYARRGDLKTKWKTYSTSSKSNFRSVSLPKNLTSQFDMANVYQVASWWFLNGHKPPFLVYANTTDAKIYTPENCDELKDEFLEDCVKKISSRHKTTENLLKTAKDIDHLFQLIPAPDFDNFMWKDIQPEIKSYAKEVWSLE